MSIQRFGAEGSKGTGGQQMPFSRAVEADGWLYVSGQVPMVDGQLVEGNITNQSNQTRAISPRSMRSFEAISASIRRHALVSNRA
jgi:enamine deaminase RidA (YjgF/YER057c/UK114 family)